MKRRLTPEQQALVEGAIPMAERISRSLVKRRRAGHLADMARSAALEALTEAACTFDASQGVPFGGFAWRRINGEVGEVLDKEAKHWAAAHSGSFDAAELVEDTSNVLVDTDEETSAQLQSMSDDVMVGALLRFVGEIQRAEGEAGAMLRERYRAVVEAVGAAVAKLAAEDRALVDLHAWQGLPWDDVATRLGIPVRTIKRRYQRIRKDVAPALRVGRADA